MLSIRNLPIITLGCRSSMEGGKGKNARRADFNMCYSPRLIWPNWWGNKLKIKLSSAGAVSYLIQLLKFTVTSLAGRNLWKWNFSVNFMVMDWFVHVCKWSHWSVIFPAVGSLRGAFSWLPCLRPAHFALAFQLMYSGLTIVSINVCKYVSM